MMLKKLEQLNIKEKEAKVYLTLLELTESNMQRLCDKAKIKRTTAYEVLKSLKEKGLISSCKKNKRTFYYAENPKRIGEKIDENKLAFKELLPQLLSMTNTLDKKPNIRFLEGASGIKEFYKDTLRHPNTELLFWTSVEELNYFNNHFAMLETYELKNYSKQRVEKKINARLIMPSHKITQKLKTEDKKNLRQIKLVSQKQFPLNVDIGLYGKNSVAIASFQESEEIVIIIKSAKIKNTLKSIFEMNWALL